MANLTEYRAENGINQRAFSEMVGVHKSIISKIESGVAKPGLDLAARIERATDGQVKAISWLKETEKQ